jgi:quinol-cytochrome oxidoreductase complex cytochrome b subunit
VRAALERELARPVAAHAARPPFALGLAAVLLLGLVALAGAFVALRWDPARLPLALAGSAARSLHAWAASALLALVLVHLLRAGWTGAYRGPRARTWLLGLANLGALLALFWVGTTLRGDQQGFEAWQHAVQVLGLAGVRAPAEAPLDALFWLHALALPGLLAAAIALHLRRVRALDLAPRDAARLASVPFRAHVRAALMVAGPAAVLTVVLAVLAPWPLGPAPLPALEAARPPWPFAWLAPLQDALGSGGIVLGLALLFGGLALLPRLDARPAGAAPSRGARALLAALLALVVVLGLWGLLGPAAPRIVG